MDDKLIQIETEKKLLACLMRDKKFFDFVNPSDARIFSRETHKHIFSVLMSQYAAGKDTDLATIMEELRQNGMLEKIEPSEVMSIYALDYTGADKYIVTLRDLADRRQIRENAGIMAGHADDLEIGTGKIISDFINAVSRKENKGFKEKNAADIAGDFGNWPVFPPIPTGIKPIDDLLSGGIRRGLTFVGAVSSLGKTSLVLQIADNLSAAGNDVLFISLEMSSRDLVAKSISRLAGVQTYDVLEKSRDFTEQINQYRDIARNLYIIEGNNGITHADIRAYAEIHKSIHGKAPILIVDYLQLLQATDPRRTDKQSMDETVSALYRIARDLETPVICISSFSRQNYEKGASMGAFKESGAIEYGADYLIGLEYATLPDKSQSEMAEIFEGERYKNAKDVRVKLLKHRNGKKKRAYLRFYADMNRYDECPHFDIMQYESKSVKDVPV